MNRLEHDLTVSYFDGRIGERRMELRDEEAVERFESFVLNQKPAGKAWEPVTPFDFESRKQVEGIHPQLICDYLVPCEDADILDYGCGPGHLVRLLREEGERRNWQIGVNGYDPHFPCVWDDREPKRGAVYDLVICREVLEHCTVRQVREVIRVLRAGSANLIYVTTRFAQSPTHLLSVDASDNLDPTHITMLTKPFLRTLFILEGCKSRPDLEERMDHKKLGRCLVMEVPQ